MSTYRERLREARARARAERAERATPFYRIHEAWQELTVTEKAQFMVWAGLRPAGPQDGEDRPATIG